MGGDDSDDGARSGRVRKTGSGRKRGGRVATQRFGDMLRSAADGTHKNGRIDLDAVVEKVVLERRLKMQKRRRALDGDTKKEEEGNSDGRDNRESVLSRLRQKEKEKQKKQEKKKKGAASVDVVGDAPTDAAPTARQREVAQYVREVITELASGAAGVAEPLSERHVAQLATDSSDGRVAQEEAQAAVEAEVARLVSQGRATRRHGVFRVFRWTGGESH